MDIGLIGLDADDTLWKNEEYYRQGRRLFDEIMAPYQPTQADYGKLNAIEIENLKYYGYGAAGFAVSLAEAAIEISRGQINAHELGRLLEVAKDIISAEVELLEGAEAAAKSLAAKYPLLLITKGDLLHQQVKVEQSGLQSYFRGVEVVSEKSPKTYQRLLDKYEAAPDRFLMVGNSMRSDIQPVLALGAWAIHLTGHTTWDFEDDIADEPANDRLYQVQTISQVPALIEEIAQPTG